MHFCLRPLIEGPVKYRSKMYHSDGSTDDGAGEFKNDIEEEFDAAPKRLALLTALTAHLE